MTTTETLSPAQVRLRRGQVRAHHTRAAFAALRARLALRKEWDERLEAAHLVRFGRSVGLPPEGGWVSGVGCDGLDPAEGDTLRALALAITSAGTRAYASLRKAAPRAHADLWRRASDVQNEAMLSRLEADTLRLALRRIPKPEELTITDPKEP